MARGRGRVPLPGRSGLAFGVLAVLLFATASRAPLATESIYGRHVYPHIARTLAHASALVPFGLSEWVLAGIVISLLAAPFAGYRRVTRAGGGPGRGALGAVTLLLGRAGEWWFAFVVLWGLNYARPLPEQPFHLGTLVDPERSAALVEEIGDRLDAVRAISPEDDRGVVRMPANLAELDDHLRGLQADVLRDADFPVVDTGRAKTFLASPLLLRWGVSGMYGPFTGEPNITWPAAPTMLPFVLAHERAHLSGFADEETASFIALLTCWRSNRPAVRYSAWLALFIEVGGHAGRSAPGVKRDIFALAAFIAHHRGGEAGLVWKAYSGYLRAHGVKGGIKSYGRVADLALEWIDAHGLPPEPAAPAVPPGVNPGRATAQAP